MFIALLTVITYICALRSEKSKNKKLPIAVGIIIGILLLAVPKYSTAISSSISRLFSEESITVSIMLPIGISFYTFSAIGYLVDVYRDKTKLRRNFLDYALYLSFFPKLVCGPIVKSDSFFKQLESGKNVISFDNFANGIQIFVFGVFKKLVIADHLSVFVNDVYNTPKAFSSLTILIAVISYSFQLYFDFSGYSDMAIGIGKILGFDLGKNFDLPYISKNLTEFWKRWHISLSSWLQEYIYYPLGGNRKGKIRTYFNLFLTMLIGGIWHGAGVTYLIWGALHGIGLILHKRFLIFKEKKFGNKNAGGKLWNTLSVLMNFVYVSLLWIFFRADSLDNALEIFKGLFSFRDGVTQIYTWTVFCAIIMIIYTVIATAKKRQSGTSRVTAFYPIANLSTFKGLILFITFTGITIYLSYFGNTAFIYGKF
ncbi:MAG: MBOAT family O-acyltransferase [Acutalibacteraceae bacterium]